MGFKKWVKEKFGLDIPARFIRGGNVVLYHVTSIPPNRNGNILLHPVKAAKNVHTYSRKEFEVTSFPRLFFYLDPEDRHKDTVSGEFLYQTTVPASQIYLMEKDPESFKEKAEVDGHFSFHYYMYLLKRAGYIGGYYNTGLTMGTNHMDVVILWVPIKATLVPDAFVRSA
jgi:hypothetical protein